MTTKISDLRPMTMGEVLDRSFQVLRRHFGPLFVTALIGIVPLLGIYLTAIPSTATVTPGFSPAMATMLFVLYILLLLTMAISWGAVTQEVDQAVKEEAVSVMDGLRHGMKAFFRVVGFWIMAYLAVLAVFLPALLAAAVVMAVAGFLFGESALAGIVGFVAAGAAFLVAGFVWAPIGFLGLPAVMIEGLGPIKALRRAHELGKGGRIRVGVTALAAWIIMILPTIGLSFAMGLGFAAFDPTVAGTASTTQLYLYQVVSFLVTGLTTPFMVAAMVFMYYDRRVRREGYDVEVVSEPVPRTV
ncbi:MAG: hypothetical protein ACN0LA_06545 [Candidatus Longimicrobiales bacterium M2_2A_002]